MLFLIFACGSVSANSVRSITYDRNGSQLSYTNTYISGLDRGSTIDASGGVIFVAICAMLLIYFLWIRPIFGDAQPGAILGHFLDSLFGMV